MFITEDYFTERTNITTKLYWKLFTKVIEQHVLDTNAGKQLS